MVDEKIQQFKEAIAECRRKGRYFSQAPRQEIIQFATSLKENGWSWEKIAEQLDISSTTLYRWREELQNTFVPIVVHKEQNKEIGNKEEQNEALQTIIVRSDSGFQILGLSFEQAILAMERLA
mgnify:CR=1 FL=1